MTRTRTTPHRSTRRRGSPCARAGRRAYAPFAGAAFYLLLLGGCSSDGGSTFGPTASEPVTTESTLMLQNPPPSAGFVRKLR